MYDKEGMEELRSRSALQPHRMKLFRNALFKRAMEWDEALATLPDDSVRKTFSDHVRIEELELADRQDSSIDGASKLAFRTFDGYLIESVILRPATGRTSLCISSQVGCACYCSFCATGKMGFTRNLVAGEILDQIRQAAGLVKGEGRSIRNVVFMGMGEPLLNPDGVLDALDFLRAPEFFNLSGSKLLVSTVGIPDAIEDFSERCPDVQLALSLHSARQDVREKLMPQAKRYPLDVLRHSLSKAAANGKIMIEYLMLKGINDGDTDFAALVEYLSGLPVHINLIPFNEYPGSNLAGTPRSERESFAARLKRAGFETTLRYSMGTDIAAACGQLVKHKRKVT
jgi:23S rRNA (adenine2503-C2)-methyltransferase